MQRRYRMPPEVRRALEQQEKRRQLRDNPPPSDKYKGWWRYALAAAMYALFNNR